MTATSDPPALPAGPAARPAAPPRARRWRLPATARTRIIGWLLLLVLVALAVVTLVTWRLLVQVTDERMDEALRFEADEFAELTATGINPRTGLPFRTVDEVIGEAIAYNLARPNEKFLGYVDGGYRTQSRQEPGRPGVLARDPAFAALVATVDVPQPGTYESPIVGEVRYLAIPVTLQGDPARGVIVAAYLADAERAAANTAAQPMLGVGGVTVLGAGAAAWLVAGRILRPLRDVAATARTITDTDLSGRIPDGGVRRARRPRPHCQRHARPRGVGGRGAAPVRRRRRARAAHPDHDRAGPPRGPRPDRSRGRARHRRARRRRAGPDEPDGLGPAAPRPVRAAVVPARRARGHRGTHGGDRGEGRAARRPGVGARNRGPSRRPARSPAHHAGRRRARRQRLPPHPSGRPNRAGLAAHRRVAAVLGVRHRPRRRSRRSRPDLRAVRPRLDRREALGRCRPRPVDRPCDCPCARRAGAARQRTRPGRHVHPGAPRR